MMNVLSRLLVVFTLLLGVWDSPVDARVRPTVKQKVHHELFLNGVIHKRHRAKPLGIFFAGQSGNRGLKRLRSKTRRLTHVRRHRRGS